MLFRLLFGNQLNTFYSSFPVPSLSPSPAAFSSTPESHRLLELELMHRWTTRTYLGLCCIPEDTPHLQDYVPRAALRNSYLMNGILALSALELSHASSSPNYLPAAIEYSNRASTDFRSQLSNITRDNLHLLYYFAMIAATFNFALPTEQTSAMERMGIAFDMVIGAVNIAMTNMQWLFDSPISGTAVMAYGTTTMDIVDLETRRALDRLTAVSCQMTPRPVSEAGEEGRGDGKEGGVDERNCLYWLAIAQLKYCFAEDVRGLIEGYCLTLIPVAGSDFVAAVRRFEPVALFILMYFGVLFDHYGQDPRMWWIASTGRDLVKETSEILLQSPIAQMEDGREGIAWTRRQVGLPAFEFGKDDCVDPNLLVLYAVELLENWSTESKRDVSSAEHIMGSRLGEVAAFRRRVQRKTSQKSLGHWMPALSHEQETNKETKVIGRKKYLTASFALRYS